MVAGPLTAASHAIASALSGEVLGLVESETAALAGHPEGVHEMRTSTRRLRTLLGFFRPLCDPEKTGALADELRWLSRCLGEVRDLDVLRTKFRGTVRGDSNGLLPLIGELDRRRASSQEAVVAALRSDRYRALRDRLIRLVRDPSSDDEAGTDAREVLPPLVVPYWKKLRDSARALGPGSSAEEFHRVRKRAKRARYAAEAILPALKGNRRKAARRFAKHAKAIQKALGEHQDAIVATREIERATAQRPGEEGLLRAAANARGTLRTAMHQARSEFGEAWGRLDRPKNRGWWHSDSR